MWVFLCVIALGSLLTPSQALEKDAVIQLTLCDGKLTRIAQDVVKTITLLSSLGTDHLLDLGGGSGKGNSLEDGLIGNTSNAVGKVVGLKMKALSVAKLDMQMTDDRLHFSLTIQAIFVLDLSVLKLVSALPVLSSTNAASGSTEIIVEISNTLPLMEKVADGGKFILGFEKKLCKLLKLVIKLNGGLLGGDGILSGVLNSLKSIINDKVGALVNNLVCETVLPTIINTVSGTINSASGVLPVGFLGEAVKSVFKVVKETVGHCLVVDINLANKGKLITVDDASGSNEIPRIPSDGFVIPKTVVDKLIRMQLTLEELNMIVLLLEKILVPIDDIATSVPEITKHGALLLKITVTNLETVLKKGATVQIKISLCVDAIGTITRERVFTVNMDAMINVDMAIDEKNLQFRCLSSSGILNVQFVSTIRLDVTLVEENFQKAVAKVIEAVNAAQISIPLMNMNVGTENTPLKIKAEEDAITFLEQKPEAN